VPKTNKNVKIPKRDDGRTSTGSINLAGFAKKQDPFKLAPENPSAKH